MVFGENGISSDITLGVSHSTLADQSPSVPISPHQSPSDPISPHQSPILRALVVRSAPTESVQTSRAGDRLCAITPVEARAVAGGIVGRSIEPTVLSRSYELEIVDGPLVRALDNLKRLWVCTSVQDHQLVTILGIVTFHSRKGTGLTCHTSP